MYGAYTLGYLYCLLVSSLSFLLGDSPGFSPIISDHEASILNFQNGRCSGIFHGSLVKGDGEILELNVKYVHTSAVATCFHEPGRSLFLSCINLLSCALREQLNACISCVELKIN